MNTTSEWQWQIAEKFVLSLNEAPLMLLAEMDFISLSTKTWTAFLQCLRDRKRYSPSFMLASRIDKN